MSDKKHLLFIYNPYAGKSRIKNFLYEIINIFVKAGYEVTVSPTQGHGDATKSVIERRKDIDLIVCSGGDGTLDEVVDGIMRSPSKVPIGYIPAGSTNDYSKSLGISSRMLVAANTIVNGNIFKSDIGSLNNEYFVYVAAFGIFTEVTYATPQNIKNALGYSAYVLEALKSIPTLKSNHIHVTWEDGEIEDDFVLGMVTNSISVGGIKGITGHHILLDDGYYEVTLIKTPASPIELNETLIAMADRKMNSDNIITFKTSHVTFDSNEPIAWTRDGEYGGHHTFAEISVQPAAFDIIVP